MRQVVLDTETTGLEHSQGHRVIEIGCVELVNRRLTGNHYHQYLRPDREIDLGAVEVHGITAEMLADKPRFADVADDLIEYLKGAELIIHNAPFDMGFLNNELRLLDERSTPLEEICGVLDTLSMARHLHPGQRNTLDALCKRYDVDNSQRVLHGALLDAEILADVYLAMTGGQTSLLLNDEVTIGGEAAAVAKLDLAHGSLRVLRASPEELVAHEAKLQGMHDQGGAEPVWRRLDQTAVDGEA
ncbi:MAG: DNA polymerase III subunit epsilon [Gammaproteobacteria bacterium]|nr:DNA polymerase III subunit epsilon [Gammaproteobacteria bacterium]